jgi:hypothetical protein
MPRPSQSLPLVVVALAACHSAATHPVSSPDWRDEHGLDREAVLLSSWQPTAPQRCVVAVHPATLPSPESLIATADMPVLLSQGGIAEVRGSALLSMRFDSTGRVERAHVIEGTIPDDVARILEQVVLSAIQPQQPGREWGVRLRIELDSAPRYRVGRSERCPAAPLPQHVNQVREVQTAMVAVPAGSTGPIGPLAGSPSKKVDTFKFAIAIDASGRVLDAKPVAASTLDKNLLATIREHILSQRWLPELDDRVPVPTMIENAGRLEGVLVPGM